MDFGEVAWERIRVLVIAEVDTVILPDEGILIRSRCDGRGGSRQACRIGGGMFQLGAPAERRGRLRGKEGCA